MSFITSSTTKKIDPDTSKALWRLLVGLVQGGILYFLYWSTESHSWPSDDRILMQVFLFIAFFVPFILLTAIGTLNLRSLIAWTLLATGVLGFLAFYNANMHQDIPDVSNKFALLSSLAVNSPLAFAGQLVSFVTVMIFIAQTLVLAACKDHKYITAYTTYFDISWRLHLQLFLAFYFMLIFGLLLVGGAFLLKMVQIEQLYDLIQHPWFFIPVTTMAFAAGIHFSDTRANVVDYFLTRLGVMGYLLPLVVGITAVFLIDLPLGGLDILWQTHHATPVFFALLYVLIVLLNSAYRNGQQPPGMFLRICCRIAALMVLPLTGLAVYGLALRVDQYGWSIERIIGACWLIAAVCYAIGYAVAALLPGRWLRAIEATNIFSAFVILAVLLALFTPVADPMRLMVASQVGRLNAGTVKVEKFDFAYVSKNGEAYAKDALNALKNDKTRIDATILQQELDKVQTPLAHKAAAMPTCTPGQHLKLDATSSFTCIDTVAPSPTNTLPSPTITTPAAPTQMPMAIPPARTTNNAAASLIPVPSATTPSTVPATTLAAPAQAIQTPPAVAPAIQSPITDSAPKDSNPAALGFQQYNKCMGGGVVSLGDTFTPDSCLTACKMVNHAAGCWWLDGTGGLKRECRICTTSPPSKGALANDWALPITK